MMHTFLVTSMALACLVVGTAEPHHGQDHAASVMLAPEGKLSATQVQEREPTMADLLYGGASAGRPDLILAERGLGPVKVPEQGYTGKKVYHTNMRSSTSDWSNEYGPDMHKLAGPAKLLGFRSGAPQFASYGFFVFILVCMHLI
mmetsp:Transcript_133989/g.267389  ORF Transcript_133989/g.267389 Transcript_133989/m.267389 type:complete len:145 (+) Transcript_133989:93-527(+)